MAWSAAARSMKVLHDDGNDSLLEVGSPGHFSFTQELNRGGGSKKRSQHHHGIKQEIEDDEFCDELSNPAEKKRRLTVDQVKFLEMSFNKDLKLEPERKALLAKHLGIRPRQVAIWFQNRRARWKNKQLEQDYETLKAKFDTVSKEKEGIQREHEEVMEENKRLQTQVGHLMSLLRSPPRNGGGGCGRDIMRGGSEGNNKSELTSPTKSIEDQSDVQEDSGQSSAVSEGAVGGGEEPVACPSYGELAPAMDSYPLGISMDDEDLAPTTDAALGSVAVPVHHFVANAFYIEDLFLYNCEDHFMGLACYGP